MTRRLAWVSAPAVLLGVALIALLVALQYGGATAPTLTGLSRGVLVGLPAAKLVVDLASAVTIGALAVAAVVLASHERAFARVADVAAAASGLWAVAGLAGAVLTYLSIGARFSVDASFGDGFANFLTAIPLGQAWLSMTLIAAAITVVCFATRNQVVLALLAVGALLGQLPLALNGHTGGTADHNVAVTSLYLHIAGASVWVGGLAVLVLLLPSIGIARMAELLPRYSSLALICFVVVAVSGYVRADVAIGSFDRLLTPYGVLVVVKVTALLVLGLFGALQRRVLIGRIAAADGRTRRAFWWLVLAELAFMGIATGVAAALGRTAPPVPEVAASELASPTPAELLTGAPLPPTATVLRYLTSVQPDVLWVLVVGFGIVLYLMGVARLRRRGDAWSPLRTVSWIAGMLLLLWVTSGGPNVYESYLFSAHMLAHMVLTMMVPLLLVPGAPVTLALRTLAKRTDGSRGPREWILYAVHSPVAKVLANPIVAAAIFAGSLLVFYYTPVFRWATTDHVGHEWMIIHFLISGYLFVQALIGIDPVPYKAPYPLKLLLLLATMGFHAFFGIAIMSSSGLLLADWYGAMGWGTDALDDQHTGGGIAWSIGELPTVTLAIVVALQWARSDTKEAKRRDRRADRDGDAELQAYNAMLERQAARDRPRSAVGASRPSRARE